MRIERWEYKVTYLIVVNICSILIVQTVMAHHLQLIFDQINCSRSLSRTSRPLQRPSKLLVLRSSFPLDFLLTRESVRKYVPGLHCSCSAHESCVRQTYMPSAIVSQNSNCLAKQPRFNFGRRSSDDYVIRERPKVERPLQLQLMHLELSAWKPMEKEAQF